MTIQASIATQQRTRLEAHFKSPSLKAYRAVLTEHGQPQNAADVQAIILTELGFLQERLRGDALNLVNNFYDDGGNPEHAFVINGGSETIAPGGGKVPAYRLSDALDLFERTGSESRDFTTGWL
ncbi:MAG: hypothetical protein WCY11_03185 [Novosphingobium sp.]